MILHPNYQYHRQNFELDLDLFSTYAAISIESTYLKIFHIQLSISSSYLGKLHLIKYDFQECGNLHILQKSKLCNPSKKKVATMKDLPKDTPSQSRHVPRLTSEFISWGWVGEPEYPPSSQLLSAF